MIARWVAVMSLIAACRPASPPYPCAPDVPGAVYHCGRIVVPESRARPGPGTGARSVALEYVVFHANRAPRQPDPIAYFADAAGESAFLGLLEIREWQLEGLDRDLIVLEQRGGGYSTPSLGCGHDATGPTSVRQCRDSLAQSGVDLTQYSVGEAAADYAALLDSLGVARVNLVGHGAGAAWALAFASGDPGRVRSVVLDAPTLGRPASAIEVLKAFDRLVVQCHRDATCRAEHPDPAGQLSRIIERLRLPGQGQRTVAAFLEMVRSGLIDHAKLGGLLAGLDAADRGDWIGAAGLLQLGADIPEGIAMHRMRSLGARWNFACAAPQGPRPLGESWPTTLVEAANETDQLEESRCASWWQARERPTQSAMRLGPQPTLVLAGEQDPSIEVARGLGAPDGRATLIVAPATGHRALVHRCPRDLVRGFLADPSRPVDQACVSRMQPVHFRLR